MGVVVTCNGQHFLLVEKGFFFPCFLVMKRVEFPEAFLGGVDLNLIIQDVLGS